MESFIETSKSYIFDLDKQIMMSDSLCLIGGIGHECRIVHSNYYHNCMNHPRNECTFQYTVSGEGAVTINKKTYALKAGQAFLVEKPGQFQYFIPDKSKYWEFKWIALNLPSIRYWKELTDSYGRIITLSEESKSMRHWQVIYDLAAQNAIGDVFMSSAHAYTFIMGLHHDLLQTRQINGTLDIFQHCLHHIQENYSDSNLSLNVLAEKLNVSTSYLSRIFKEHMKETYSDYLAKHRMQKACELFLLSDTPVSAVAQKVGIPDSNYFSRVFKQFYGVSPTVYKRNHLNKDTILTAQDIDRSIITD